MILTAIRATRQTRKPLRRTLMMSCASVAFAAIAVSPQAASAQAFRGSISSATGSVSRTSFTDSTETITVGTNKATINWTPSDGAAGGGAVNFLPNGNTATFTSTPGITDYTVLNRIISADTSRAVGLNGHVISTLQGTSTTGGKVWFYSPGGIVVGSTAVFDVGGLLLSANDVTSFSNSDTNFTASFAAGAPGSKVSIAKGAAINALQQNSYVALIAPRVEQAGNVRVSGSAAYVAANQLTMTMNQGLFDIQVDVGTDDPNGVVHTGSTTGPANVAASDNHSIYMVAVPKNSAVTMLLSGGTVGFDASEASVQNGQIILSSGQGVSKTAFNDDWKGGAIGGPGGNITISGGNYTSSTTARATGSIDASGGAGALTFAGDLSLQALNSAILSASVEETVTIHGNARVSADDLRIFDTDDDTLALDAVGGWAEITAASGGHVTIGGTATVTADARGATNFESLTGGTAEGGSANIDTWDGTISIGGATKVSANALADGHSHAGIDGRDSFGGDAEVLAGDGGSITIGGKLEITADAFGTNSLLASEGTGGFAYGGDVSLVADGGSISVAGNTNLSAGAVGGNGNLGGGAQGGTVELTSDSWDSETLGSLALHDLGLFANADQGLGDSGGQMFPGGTAGVIEASATGGSITAGNVTIRANGSSTGGLVAIGTDSGGDAMPGSIHFDAVDARANGALGTGGLLGVFAGAGSVTDLGNAFLSVQGATGGNIFLIAGGCDCSGEGESLAAHAEALSDAGGITGSNITLNTSGNIQFYLTGGADISVDGKLDGQAGQMVSMFDDGTGGALRAHEFDLFAVDIAGDVNIIADIIRLTALGGLSVGDLNATDSIALNATTDLITGDLSATNSIQVASRGDVEMGDLKSASINAVSLFGNLSAADVDASSATITAAGNTTIGDLVATGATLVIGGVNIETGDLTSTAALTIHAGQDATLGDLSSPTLVLTGRDVTVGDVTATDFTLSTSGGMSAHGVHATNSATFNTDGLASFFGIVNSPTITVTSGDINIAEGASLGVAGVTNLITLNAVSHGLPIMLGDGGEPAKGQYQLSEDGEIHSNEVVLNAVAAKGASAPDVQVFDAQIEGSATTGGGVGSVTINTDGNVFVLGDVEFINAAATDKLSINAGNLIQVDTDGGKIAMLDTAGKLAGTLELNADNVWVGDGSLLDQLKANVNFAGRETALGTNNSADNPDGFIRAGTITAKVANSFLVQNSGSADQFAGVDAGDGGLGITSTSTAAVTVIAYGRQTLTGGSTITNEDFLGSVELTGAGGFTTDSAVNGCPIGGGGCHLPDLAFDSSSVLGGVSSDDEDKDKDKEQSDESDDGSNADPALKLINTLPVNLDHHIDDPVTSGGDVVIGGGPGGEI